MSNYKFYNQSIRINRKAQILKHVEFSAQHIFNTTYFHVTKWPLIPPSPPLHPPRPPLPPKYKSQFLEDSDYNTHNSKMTYLLVPWESIDDNIIRVWVVNHSHRRLGLHIRLITSHVQGVNHVMKWHLNIVKWLRTETFNWI